MKTISTLFASLILSVAVMAAPKDNDTRPKGVLTVKSSDRGDLKVIIDGRRFEPNDNYLRIQGIETGYHSVKVYQEKNTGIFSIFGKTYQLVFNSSVSMKPFSTTNIMVDRFGQATVNESRVNGRFGRRNRNFGGRDDSSWDNDHDFNFDGGGHLGDYDNGHDGKIDGPGYNDYSYNNTMSDREFNRVITSIGKEWFETNKSESAKQIISTNNFTSVQVKELLQLFNYDNTKLELAKLAYTKTVDKKNFFMVNDVFSFNSSKDELARFIRSCE